MILYSVYIYIISHMHGDKSNKILYSETEINYIIIKTHKNIKWFNIYFKKI